MHPQVGPSLTISVFPPQESAAGRSHGHDCILQGPSKGACKQDASGTKGHHPQAQAALQLSGTVIE